MPFPAHPGRPPVRVSGAPATLDEALARRLDSARSALDCAVMVACSVRGVVGMDLTCWDSRAGYAFMLWTGGFFGGPADSRMIADGPHPLDALLEMFPSVGACLQTGDADGCILGDGVVSAELVALLPLGYGETAHIAFRRIGWLGRMARPRNGAG